MEANKALARWIGMSALAFAMAACGGGGGGGDASTTSTGGTGTVPPAPVADARNGTYNVVAADAREYTLTLDFDAHTYRMLGSSSDQSGSFAQDGADFTFQPGNSTGAAGFNTARFSMATDTVVGEFNFAQGTVPFVAGRSFVSTTAGAVGIYNLLGRRVDATGAAIDTTIQQGEITADGNLRTCDQGGVVIETIADCPAASVTTSPLTLSGNVFTATVTGQGTYTFRVAQVGSDKVFLRASASSSGTSRFILGTPATGSLTPDAFNPGTFVGGTTEPAWGTITLGASTFASTGTSPAGVTSTRSGSSGASGPVQDIRFVSTNDAGTFYAARSSEIGIVVSASGNSLATGFVAIGKAQ